MKKYIVIIFLLSLFSCDSVSMITKQEYDQIRNGMSYSEVVDIIGEHGEETVHTSFMGITTVGYQWVNFDGSNAQLMFQDGELMTKAQAFLK